MKTLLSVIISFQFITGFTQIQPEEEWWLKEPYRLIQTNLREIDAIDFDIDIYVNSLIEIGANTVLINVGGIVANYYTDLEFHYQNPYMEFDLIMEVIGRLHQEGIWVIGRFDFSKLNEKHANQNPEWLYINLEGEKVNYNGQVHTCVNGGYQQEYSKKILSEALTKFPLDGIFFNMIGYQTRDYSHHYHGICQSGACRERFREWSGGLDLPVKESMDDPVFRQYQKFKSETSNELFVEIHDLIKSFGDHIAINTYTHAGTDFYRRESNSHAALYDNNVPWEYSAVHNVKATLGSFEDKQTSNAAVHFYGYPARHTADARWLTESRLFQNVMHGAGPDFYCIGRLDNLEDRFVLDNVRDIFQFHKEHEEYLHHTSSGNTVLVLHDDQSHGEYMGIVDVLSENHVLFDVMEHWCIDNQLAPRKIESYDLIILPDISRLSDAQCLQLDKYVKEGGRILATGLTSVNDELGNPMKKVRMNSLGVEPEYKPFDKVQGTYFRIFEKDKETLGKDRFQHFDLVYAWEQGMLCEPAETATGYLGFIPPAMIGPPEKCYYEVVTEIPGLIHNKHGNGQTAFLTFRAGELYHRTRHYGHAELILAAMSNLLEFKQDLHVDASPLIEISRQTDPDGTFEWYGFLNHTGQLGRGYFQPVPIYDIEIKFKPGRSVKGLRSLKSEENPVYEIRPDGWIEATLPRLDTYDILLIEYE